MKLKTLFITLLVFSLIIPAAYGSQTSPLDITTITEDGHIRSDTNYKENTTNNIRVGHQSAGPINWRGFIEWDTSAIPDASTIYSVHVTLYGYADNTGTGGSNVAQMTNQPSVSANNTIHNDAGDSTYGTFPEITENASSTLNLGATAVTDLEGQLAADWFAIGLNRVNADDDAYYWSRLGPSGMVPLLMVSSSYGNYTFVCNGTYYENGTRTDAVDVTMSTADGSYTETVNGTLAFGDTTLPIMLFYTLPGGGTRRLYTTQSENFTITIPDDTYSTYAFTVRDYTNRLRLGTAYLEAWRNVNGTSTLIERAEITTEATVPMNLVQGEVYQLRVLWADGSRTTWGYYIPTSDTTTTILLRGVQFSDQAYTVNRFITVEVTRVTTTSIEVNYSDTRLRTTWANVTVRIRGGAVVNTTNTGNNSYSVTYTGLDADTGYVVTISGYHLDCGEWGYSKILDQNESFPDPPDFTGIITLGGIDVSQIIGYALTLVCLLTFSYQWKGRGLLATMAVATIINYLGLMSLTYNLIALGWTFSVAVVLISEGRY